MANVTSMLDEVTKLPLGDESDAMGGCSTGGGSATDGAVTGGALVIECLCRAYISSVLMSRCHAGPPRARGTVQD